VSSISLVTSGGGVGGEPGVAWAGAGCWLPQASSSAKQENVPAAKVDRFFIGVSSNHQARKHVACRAVPRVTQESESMESIDAVQMLHANDDAAHRLLARSDALVIRRACS
jgi:hypothetical protein